MQQMYSSGRRLLRTEITEFLFPCIFLFFSPRQSGNFIARARVLYYISLFAACTTVLSVAETVLSDDLEMCVEGSGRDTYLKGLRTTT
jgi:hypothetical protein